jgi:uncharacterized protein YcgL (UPF0745 family)
LICFFASSIAGLLQESITNAHFHKHIAFLKGRFEQCIKHFKLRFKQHSSGKYILQQVNEYAFLDLLGLLHQKASLENDSILLNDLITQSLPHIPIHRTSIKKALYTKNNKEFYLEITAQLDFAELQPQEARFHYYRSLLHDEVTRIKQSLHHQTFRLQSEKQVELFIQNHQHALETLTQSLLSYLDEQDRKHIYSLSGQYTQADLCKIVYQYLEKVQRHIERYFTKYLAFDASIPYRSRLLSSVEINKKLKVVYKRLEENNLDEKLLKIINRLLTKLSHITLEERFTYQALIYHKMVLDELYAALQANEGSLTNELLIEILYRLNFNSVDFFHYLTSGIEGMVAAEENMRTKRRCSIFTRKCTGNNLSKRTFSIIKAYYP